MRKGGEEERKRRVRERKRGKREGGEKGRGEVG